MHTAIDLITDHDIFVINAGLLSKIAKYCVALLQEYCLAGLGNLTYLDLQGNRLSIYGTDLPQNVFWPVPKLSTLELRYNGGRYSQYNVQVFTVLSHLETLGIDGASDLYFPPGFAALRNLKTLRIKIVSSHLRSLRNESFEAFTNSSLMYLLIDGHGAYNFLAETCTFCPCATSGHWW